MNEVKKKELEKSLHNLRHMQNIWSGKNLEVSEVGNKINKIITWIDELVKEEVEKVAKRFTDCQHQFIVTEENGYSFGKCKYCGIRNSNSK